MGMMVAGTALWLLLAGPRQLLGWDTGHLGMILLLVLAFRVARAFGVGNPETPVCATVCQR